MERLIVLLVALVLIACLLWDRATCREGYEVRRNMAKPSDYYVCTNRR